MVNRNDHHGTSYKYLALIPRGLQGVVSDMILKATKTNDNDDVGDKKRTTTIFTIGEQDNLCTGQTAKQALEETMILSSQKGTSSFDERAWCQHPVGSIELRHKYHVSVGYDNTTTDKPDQSQTPQPTWSCPGQLSGSVWLRVDTPNIDQMQNVRCLGPILSLVTHGQVQVAPSLASSTNPPIQEHQHRQQHHSLKEMTHAISQWICTNNNYAQDLARAIDLWKEHVKQTWKNNHQQHLSPIQYKELEQRVSSNRIRFRVSCVRDIVSESDQEEPSPYTRNELVRSVMDECGSELVPYHHPSTGDGWKVDLVRYDLELVLILLQQQPKRLQAPNHQVDDVRSTNHYDVALGISLCPYSFCKSKSFATGNIPPDVTPPYLGGDILSSSGITRLRPTTANILLELAMVHPYETVLDPCAGIGTIPVEADQYYFNAYGRGNGRCIGLGGDIVLNHPIMASAASALEEQQQPQCRLKSRKATQSTTGGSNSGSSSGSSSSSLLAAWDAAQLPIRTATIDAIVSDLPFGQQCLSAKAVNQLVPLIFRECARVLVPTTTNANESGGRMVLLCGHFQTILKGLEESKVYWKQPCTAITPVTIGGILAWIVRVERNDLRFEEDDMATTKYLNRVRKIAKRRDQIAKHVEKSNIKEQQKKRLEKPSSPSLTTRGGLIKRKRRIQS